MLKKLFAASVISAMLVISALADQAAYITKEQADKTVAFLKGKEEITHFCAPCDDQSKTVETIDNVAAVKVDYQDYWEVQVNGKGIDLAYVYYKDKKGRWKNLAKEMKIKVTDVPEKLDN